MRIIKVEFIIKNENNENFYLKKKFLIVLSIKLLGAFIYYFFFL